MDTNATTNTEQDKLRRILLVRNDRIGDLVLTLPAFEAARRRWPGAQLTALVAAGAGPLVARHPAVDQLLLDDAQHTGWQLARRLRELQFDAALVFNTNTRNCLAVWAARIPCRVCWAYKPAGSLAATHRVALRRSHPPVHEAEFALEFVRRLGGRATLPDLLPQLPIEPAARRAISERIARQLPAAGPLFGVHPGGRHSAYNWPPARYAELVRRLASSGRVMVTGSPSERPILETIRRALPDGLSGRVGFFLDLALPELAAAIAQLSVLVVSSTGPMHIAGAVGTPTVALFSPHPAHVPAKWAPLGEDHTVLVAPLADGENPRVPSERGEELMSRIGVDQVLAATLRYASRAAAGAA